MPDPSKRAQLEKAWNWLKEQAVAGNEHAEVLLLRLVWLEHEEIKRKSKLN